MKTLQPVLNTRTKQMQSWCELILDFARHHKLYCLNIPEAVATSPLFNNNKIQRRLSVDVARIFLDYVVSKNFGEWLDKEKNNILLYWRTPEEWANIIYKRICDLGMTDTVVTFYELTESESAANEEFYKLDIRILMKALQCLERRGLAKVFSGNQKENLGVKFFSQTANSV
jgi:ESCRT-II complex subunit VPS25